MTIRLDWNDEQDLRWFVSGDYRGDMGERSAQGGAFDALALGAIVQTSGRDGDISDRKRRAAARLDGILSQWRRCSLAQKAILTEAFAPVLTEGLEAYGPYPRAVLACPEAMAAKGDSSRSLPDWLVRRAHVAALGEGEDQAVAERVVAELRTTAECRLVEALRAYGARVEVVSGPDEVSLRELGRALGQDHKTMKSEVARRGVSLRRRSDSPNARAHVSVDELKTRWPHAAEAVARRTA